MSEHWDWNLVDRVIAGAGRLVARPARAMAQTPAVRQGAGRLAEAGADALSAPAAERAVDGLLSGPLPETLAHSLVEHRVIERMAAQVLKSADFERSVLEALESDRAEELTQRVLASPGLERIITGAVETRLAPMLARALSNPEVQAAFARQSGTLAGDVADGLHGRAVRIDDSIERGIHRRRHFEASQYAGIASRLGALVLDALIITVAFVTMAALVGMVASLVGHLRPQWLVGVIMGAGWVVAETAYFIGFWSTAGQTPGMRVFRLRVAGRFDSPPGFWRSVVRLFGLWLAIAPLFLGFVPVLFSRKRRALQDYIAGTDVVYTTPTAPLSTNNSAAE